MPETKRIVFLYTELASYVIACIGELAHAGNYEIHVVRWPVNNEAPFDFSAGLAGIQVYDRNRYSNEDLMKLVNDINPHVIYCSGWIDKGYTAVCRKWKNKIPVIAGIDTWWNGSMKQRLHTMLSPFTVQRTFSHIWVAGEPQLEYARRLGFTGNKVRTGVYSADVPFFNAFYKASLDAKAQAFPKRFVFAGRYLEFKGIFDLWEAFIKTFDTLDHDWELWCLGTGALWDKRVTHPRIKHLGFVQPADMGEVLAQTGVFILPSHFEPWAVAVHEYAAAGYPLICSDKVGAASLFLQLGQNGYTYSAGNVAQLTQCMLACIQAGRAQLLEMGRKSHVLAQVLTPKQWAQNLVSLLQNR